MATFQGSWPLISLNHPCPSPLVLTRPMEHGHGPSKQLQRGSGSKPWVRARHGISGLQVMSISHWRMRCSGRSASGGGRRIMAAISCAATANDSVAPAAPQGSLVGDGPGETASSKPPPPPPGPRNSKRSPSAAAAAFKLQREEDAGDVEWLSYMGPAKQEVFAQLEPWAEANLLPFLKPPPAAWQPTDMLPDAAALGEDGFRAACSELRARAAGVPDALLVCLVGNTVTEEALPTYQSFLNRVEPIRDLTGSSATAWARWIRGWTAEENRHGDVLTRYLFLSGRVDMRQVETTTHHLLQSGMLIHAPRSPYHSTVYVAFQERATAISHGNTARLAKAHGDSALARICGAVAADEKRHEAAYARLMGRLFEIDPDGAVRALAYVMRRRVTMPASLMTDGRDGDLFAHFAAVAQRAGLYTASDYRGIVEHMIKLWRVEELGEGLSGEGRRAQDYVCALPEKIRRLEEKAHERSKAQKPAAPVRFSWIFDRPV